jgi:CBS domain-containing protein
MYMEALDMAQQTIAAVLKSRTTPVVTCRPDDSIQLVVGLLHRYRIGALPVTDGDGRLVGVVSERDVIRALAANQGDVRGRKVSELMTRDVVTCAAATTIKDAARLMDTRRIRHLPVMEGSRVVDMVSLRDVVSLRLSEAELEADVLREYAIASGGLSAH